MEMDNAPIYLQFYECILRFKRTGQRIPRLNNGLSHPEFLCLDLLKTYMERHPELPGMKISLLSDLTNTSRPSISQHISSLEKKGYVMRTNSTKDRRVTYLCLTPEATTLFEQAEKNFMRFIQLICDKLGPEDTIKTMESINKLSQVLDAICENYDPSQNHSECNS